LRAIAIIYESLKLQLSSNEYAGTNNYLFIYLLLSLSLSQLFKTSTAEKCAILICAKYHYYTSVTNEAC